MNNIINRNKLPIPKVESVELEEISKKTISSALTKAGDQMDDPSMDPKKKVKRAKFINKAFSSLYANKTKFKEDVEQVDESLVGSALAAAAIGHAVHGDHTANAKSITRANNPVMMAHAPNGGKLPNIKAPTAKPVKNKQGGYTQCAGSCTNEQVEVHFHGKEGYGVSQNGRLVKHHDDHAAAVAHAKSLSPVIQDLTESFDYDMMLEDAAKDKNGYGGYLSAPRKAAGYKRPGQMTPAELAAHIKANMKNKS
jgi:hypothetical protein